MSASEDASSSPAAGALVQDASRWFSEEVHPHESALRSYLRGAFPRVRDVDDVVQESYLRLWRARAAHPILCGRAFLFGIARRLAVDVIRKERRTPVHEVDMDSGFLSVLEDRPDAAEALSSRQEITLLAEALHSLPPRCREIMILRKIERLSHKEISERLRISPATVETQIFRGMEKCTRYLRRHGVVAPCRGSAP